MDYIVGLPKSKKENDSFWVIIERLTKSAHFIPVKTNCTAKTYARIFVRKIIRLHGVPDMMVSDRGSVFISYFWKGFQDSFGNRFILQ